jgi:mono/diheme cytochrome c family protein
MSSRFFKENKSQMYKLTMPKTYSMFVTLILLFSALPAFSAPRKADAKAGKQLFEAMNCSMCHPSGGNALNPKKPLRGEEFKKTFSDADIALVVRKGVPGTAMDAFRKDRLSDEQLSDIIAYIRTLTPAQVPVPIKTAVPAGSGKCGPNNSATVKSNKTQATHSPTAAGTKKAPQSGQSEQHKSSASKTNASGSVAPKKSCRMSNSTVASACLLNPMKSLKSGCNGPGQFVISDVAYLNNSNPQMGARSIWSQLWTLRQS